jgi:hypothetical protein
MDAAMPFPLNLSLGYAVLLFQSFMRYPYLQTDARFGHLWASINAKRWKKLLDPGVARKLPIVHKAEKRRYMMHCFFLMPLVWQWKKNNRQV